MTAQWFTCLQLSFQAGFSSSKNVHRRLRLWRFHEFLWKSRFKSSNPSRWANGNALFQIYLINNQNLRILFFEQMLICNYVLKEVTVFFSEIWNNINGKLKFLKYFRNMLIQNSSMCAIIYQNTAENIRTTMNHSVPIAWYRQLFHNSKFRNIRWLLSKCV